MKPVAGFLGMLGLIAIFIVSFYAYTIFSKKESSSVPPQEASISNAFSDSQSSTPPNNQLAINTKPTTTRTLFPLEGFDESEFKERLESIKNSLDLLQNPVE